MGPSGGNGTLGFELKNDLTEIATLAAALDDFCARHGIGWDVKSVVNLALEEVVTGIISDGYGDGGDRRIWIDLAVNGGDFTARVQDDAAPIDPLAQDGSDAGGGGRPGALGIHIVKTLMDEVTYAREQGRNVLVLRKSMA